MNHSEEIVDPATDVSAPPPDSYQPPTAPHDSGPRQSSVSSVATGPWRGGRRKSVFLACCLSLLPGVGQVYVGYYKLGFIHNLIFAGAIMLLVTGPADSLATFLGVFLAFFYVYNIVDAGRRAGYYNLAVDGVEGIELPDDMHIELPSVGGSVAGGVLLVALGAVLLSNTLFGVSLAWVEDWWPALLIGFGGYLIWKARQERPLESDDE